MPHMLTWKKLCVVPGAIGITTMLLAAPSVAADQFSNFPFVISCEYKGMFHAFYLSRVTPDGTATYTASERMAGTISLNGQAKAVGGSNGGTCLGKTLKELKALGQAHFLP